jgi:hypothetical protein
MRPVFYCYPWPPAGSAWCSRAISTAISWYWTPPNGATPPARLRTSASGSDPRPNAVGAHVAQRHRLDRFVEARTSHGLSLQWLGHSDTASEPSPWFANPADPIGGVATRAKKLLDREGWPVIAHERLDELQDNSEKPRHQRCRNTTSSKYDFKGSKSAQPFLMGELNNSGRCQ